MIVCFVVQHEYLFIHEASSEMVVDADYHTGEVIKLFLLVHRARCRAPVPTIFRVNPELPDHAYP